MTTTKVVLLLLCQLFCLVLAVDPTVNLICNKYTGYSTPNGITQWLGIRYAAPPLGDLRFAPPQDPPCNITATQDATQHGPVCLSVGSNPPSSGTAEDCLFLDVYAPSNATRNSRLPVFVFIQGGGFSVNSNPNLNGSGLIEASDYNVIIVTFNYRVGPYGFITNGNQIKANNGLRDQRKALQWVNRYIAAFGGDPGHVVIGGDSAGAASISLQMIAYGGKNSGLFHGAAAESVSFAPVLTIPQSQYQYNNFSMQLGCNGTDSLACLRSKTYTELQTANTVYPYPGLSKAPLYMWNPVIDNDFITDYTYSAFAKGNFVKIPVIYGDDTNGGTVFTPQDTSTLAASNQFIQQQFPNITQQQLEKIDEMYPNPNDTCPNTGCYWRQVSNVYGDMRYMCPTLYISSAMTKYGVSSAYSYRYNVEDPMQVAEGLGVPHTVELSAIWGPQNTNGSPPKSYVSNGTNIEVIPVIQAYWTSFIRTFDPNTFKDPSSATWEKWDASKENRLLFETGGVTTMENVDDDTKAHCQYFASIGVDIQQ
ncbi:alpha/beta-hydrolase [Annulohypoxylon moriforme]|nr:alpha/beta-hydrolase [Annulohypoxylon moriforme]